MTTTRDDLHRRINDLPDDRLAQVAALLDALDVPSEPVPPTGTLGELVDFLRAHRDVFDARYARALQAAHDEASTPLPLRTD